jgi:NAD(P)-dependent dehydrogenase (short-subunit alcohol dehydrogenase family)
MRTFATQVALITGAGRGRGRALAQAFAEAGAAVAANDIAPNNLEQLVADITRNGGQARSYIEDVAKKVAAQALIKQVEDDFGRIDILVNHASVEPRAALLEMDEWDWRRAVDVNLTGAFLMTQSVGRIMAAQGGGVIVNLLAPLEQESEGRAAYLASMAALEAFSRSAGLELAPHNIHVHAISAAGEGLIETVLDLCGRRA